MIYHFLEPGQSQILSYFTRPKFYLTSIYDIPSITTREFGFTLDYGGYAFSINTVDNNLDQTKFKNKFVYSEVVLCSLCQSNLNSKIFELVEFRNSKPFAKAFFCKHNVPYIINKLGFLVD